MWEMQQLGRRAVALNVDLISNRLGEMAPSLRLPSSAQACVPWGWMREKMENVRGPRRVGLPDLTAFDW